jgi:hypothetical protein
MPPPPPAEAAPAGEVLAARLLEALAGLDLTSADGRAGIGTLLSEIERACPGAILQQAARIELRAVGWRRSGSEAPRAER